MLVFTTGRVINGKQQVIEAKETPEGITFHDLALAITGVMHCAFASAAILLNYDTGNYQHAPRGVS